MKKLLSLILLLSFTIKAQDIKIGTQTWTSKNLDVSTYRNGDTIPEVQDKNAWASLTTGAWCYYDNDAANGSKYGKLYNWYAVIDPSGLAPIGYHIPTDAEWITLTNYLEGESEAGLKMKSRNGWQNNGNGTNTSGFEGLPGGYLSIDGNFKLIGANSDWWSSTDTFFDEAWARYLVYESIKVGSYKAYKRKGLSVRCIKD